MHIVKNLTRSQVVLVEGAIDLAGKDGGSASRARLPDFARHHDDIELYEEQGRISVEPLHTDDGDQKDKQPIEEDEVEDQSPESTEVSAASGEDEVDAAEDSVEDSEEDKEQPEGAEPEDTEEVEDEEDEESGEDEEVMSVDTFSELNADAMKEKLRELGEDEEADLRSKDKMVEHYEKHVI